MSCWEVNREIVNWQYLSGIFWCYTTDVVTDDHAFPYLLEYNLNVPASVLLPSKKMAAAVIAVQDILSFFNFPEPSKRLKEASLQEIDLSWLCSEN